MGWIRVLAFREDEPKPWGNLKGGYRYNGDAPRIDDNRSGLDAAPKSERGRQGTESTAPPTAAAPEARDIAPRAQAENHLRDESGNPGTGWGRREQDEVRRVDFRAQREATDHIVMRYEYEGGLRALGIYPRRLRTFDREEGQFGFAQPPRW
jgi:hypothetical protein